MLYFLYDNTFEGLLTAVFEAFNRKEFPDRIVSQNIQLPLFTDAFQVISDTEKSERVLSGLKKKISRSALNMLFTCYFSERTDIEILIFRYIRKAFASPVSIEMNFADDDVLALSKIFKKVQRETERIKQFVRFQKTSDGMFFALVEPLYNVLPLCSSFFEDRYADQLWILYDSKRNYGLYYDLKKTEVIHFEHFDLTLKAGQLSVEQMDEYEAAFQKLWKDYLAAVTIQERKNLRLQRQFMPKRFWKYLIEI
ncbi:MAG: TIGR03915 family putative DNA repair protein [Dysgonamonadaceae bacterium]|jgi:probable DNA metabolism protein|nr:TIGR03915 family putative DNA repair protein [Dysgonamonadaceae bacterium]